MTRPRGRREVSSYRTSTIHPQTQAEGVVIEFSSLGDVCELRPGVFRAGWGTAAGTPSWPIRLYIGLPRLALPSAFCLASPASPFLSGCVRAIVWIFEGCARWWFSCHTKGRFGPFNAVRLVLLETVRPFVCTRPTMCLRPPLYILHSERNGSSACSYSFKGPFLHRKKDRSRPAALRLPRV